MLDRNSSGSDRSPVVGPVDRKQPSSVGLKSGEQGRGGRFKVADRGGIVFTAAAEAALEALGPAGLAARGAPDDRQELLVDEQPALGKPLVPLLADRGAERGIELAARSDGHPAPNDMMVEHEACIEHAPKQDFTNRLGVVELVGVLGLELHPADVQRAHDRAIAKPNGRVVDVPFKRQAVPSASFPLRPLGSTGPFHSAPP